MNLSRHPLFTWIIRALIASAAAMCGLMIDWVRPDAVKQIDEYVRDTAMRLAADVTPETRIAIVDINEASIAAYGPWPWPRERIADVIEILLAKYQALAVGVDIVFPDPGSPDGDARLAALAIHAPVALAQVFDYAERIDTLAYGTLGGGFDAESGRPAVPARGFIANHVGFKNARCVGNIGYVADTDGVLRRVPLITSFGGRNYPHLATALLECSGIENTQPIANSDGFWRLPFRKALAAYAVTPALAVLNETAPLDLFEGRYVILGSSALSLGDRVRTPLASLSSGMFVHATSLSALLDVKSGAQNIKPWSGRGTLIAWILLSCSIAVIAMSFSSAWGNVLILLVMAASWAPIALWGAQQQAEWSISGPLWSYLFLLLAGIPHEWWLSQMRERRLFETFSHYVDKPVLSEILRRDLAHSLEPQQCEVTVLVADMACYTATTSALPLSEAATLTKDFLGCLTRPVLAANGTLDKYTGDGMVAFWGAPLTCADQADRAVRAAIEIEMEVAALNVRRGREGFAPLRVCIGIESGTALVGDLGTDFRSTYTAVGNCINFASRLEEAARKLPSNIVIGPNANVQLRTHRTKSMGSLKLRGTQIPIEVFRIAQASATPGSQAES